MTTLDLNTAVRIVNEAVTVKGENHVQHECYYVEGSAASDLTDGSTDTRRPGCIVGVALWNLMGDEWAKVNLGTYSNNGNIITAIADSLPDLTIEDDALTFLNDVQEAQDGRSDVDANGDYHGGNMPWGMAVEFAQERLRERESLSV